MRYFPNAASRRMTGALTLGALAIGVLSVPLAHAEDSPDDLKDQQAQVERKIKVTKRSLDGASHRVVQTTKQWESAKVDLSQARTRLSNATSSLQQARTELGVARTELAEARLEDQRLKDELAQAKLDLVNARNQLAAGRIAKDDQSDRVADMIAEIYMNGDPTLLSYTALANAQTPEDLMRQSEARQVIAGEQTAAYEDLRLAELDLEAQEAAEQAAKEKVASQSQAAADHLVVVQGLETDAETAKNNAVAAKGEAKKARTRVAIRVDKRAKAKSKALAARAADRRTLAKLKKDKVRLTAAIKEAARKARIEAQKAGQNTAPQNSGGFLNRPVSGEVTSPYGYRVHPIYGYWGLHDGTDFGAPCGAPLYADADGVVLERYWSDSYGNRLVLDNGFQRGVGLASIYNHATNYVVDVGDHVTRGQVIGYVGSTGWSTGCHLHFTVMENGKTVDPMGWL